MTAKQYYHFLCAGRYDPAGNWDPSRYCDDMVSRLFNVLRHSFNKYEPVPSNRVMDGYDLMDFDVVVRVASGVGHPDFVDPCFACGGLFYVDFISPGEDGGYDDEDDTYFACDCGVTPALAFLAAIDAWFILVSRTFGLGDPGYVRLLGRRFAYWLDARGMTC